MGLLWHLALRQCPSAMTERRRRIGEDGLPIADSFSAAGLACRASRLGDPVAVYYFAMTRFNRGDLQGYRYWLRRAARAGDDNARRQLRRFKIQLLHGAAHDIGRGRSRLNYD